MRTIVRFAFLAALAAACAAPAFAEDARQAGLSPDELKKALGLSIYIQGGITGNRTPSNLGLTQAEENDLRVFDHKANSFTLDLAQIVLSRDTTAIDTAGYKIKLSTGETAKWIHARGLSGAAPTLAQTGQNTDAFDLTEAYISYLAPVGRGLRFDFGKMVTFFGSEVIEARDNANYSRSFLFDFAIPYTHTGLKTSYALSAALSASLYVVNGWDNADDNNTGKSLGLGVGYAPSETFAGYFNIMTGPEQDRNSSNDRTLADLVAVFKPARNMTLIVNYDYGTEEKAVAAGTAAWSGLAGIAKYDFNDRYGLAARAEFFRDRDGFRTGAAQSLREVTVTPEIRLASGLVVRPEYRHDRSNKRSFAGFTKKSQDTLALGVMYTW